MKNSLIAICLAAAATSTATPSATAAPPCTEWTHNGPMHIQQDNGLVVAIDQWSGTKTQSNATLYLADGKAASFGGGNGVAGSFAIKQTGPASGQITGNKLFLEVFWASGDANRYIGTVDDVGFLTGTSTNNKGVTNKFGFEERFTCAQREAAPAEAPGTVKTTMPVNLYAQPGQTGGGSLGLVPTGTTVSVVELRGDWVHVHFFLMTHQLDGWVAAEALPKT